MVFQLVFQAEYVSIESPPRGVEALLLAAGDRSAVAAVWLGWLMRARRTEAGREV